MNKPEMIIVGNWKMNLSPGEAETLADEICRWSKAFKPKAGVVLVPPFPYLQQVVQIGKQGGVAVGAQNVAAAKGGAHTGEVSAIMIKDCGAKYVLIGHSERRQYQYENESLLRVKIEYALEAGLSVVYCVGETLEQRKAHRQFEIVGSQLNQALMGIAVKRPRDLLIAYEPVWAIGTGEVATPAQAAEVHKFIRRQLATLFPMFAAQISILYGGSVKPDNASGLFGSENINGALVGGASLKAEEFINIIIAAHVAVS